MIATLIDAAFAGPATVAATRARVRAVAGDVGPVGDENGKTGSTGTYRPVGPTCPTSCQFLGNGCYAQRGRTALAAGRGSATVDPSVAAAVVALSVAARTGGAARLHVSGDFGSGGAVDHGYVHAVAEAAELIRARAGRTDAIGWSYTHFGAGPWVELLRDAGVMVRASDRMTGPAGGAIVVGSKAEGRAQGAAVCPAQLRAGYTCAECRLCWTRPDVTIAFIRH